MKVAIMSHHYMQDQSKSAVKKTSDTDWVSFSHSSSCTCDAKWVYVIANVPTRKQFKGLGCVLLKSIGKKGGVVTLDTGVINFEGLSTRGKKMPIEMVKCWWLQKNKPSRAYQPLKEIPQTEAHKGYFSNHQHFTVSTSICGVASPSAGR